MLAVLVIGLVLTMGAARLGARSSVGRGPSPPRMPPRSPPPTGSRSATVAVQPGPRPPTPRASNDARLVSCDCSGTTAEVVVEVDVPAWGALAGPARGRAKAEVRPECVVDLAGC